MISVRLRADRAAKNSGEKMRDLMGFDTAARTGWYCLGTRARHCKATSFGSDGMRIAGGASVVAAVVDMVFSLLCTEWST